MSNEFETDTPKIEVSTTQLDKAIFDLVEARKAYDLAKAISTEKNAEVDKCEMELMKLLESADKSVYLSDIARVTVVSKMAVTTPKTMDQKKDFFEWIKGKYGEETLLAYQTVNYQSLNSLYNKAMEEANKNGEILTVPGIDMPTLVRSLQVRQQ